MSDIPTPAPTNNALGLGPLPAMPPVPDYTEMRPLGRGGFGTVYLVKDITGSPFALKVVTGAEVGDNYKYKREYDSICKHRQISDKPPSLLQILHVGKDEGFFYYTMPLADGIKEGPFDPYAYRPKTLDAVIRSHNGAMPIKDAIEAVIPVLDALQFLHGKELLHRDVKPDNIIYLNGKPVLGDIGLITEPKPDMTIVHSPGFSPPDGVVDFQGDLCSVGKTLFFAIGGDVTKPGLSVPTIAGDDSSGLFPALNKIITKAFRRKYESAAAMKKDVERLFKKATRPTRRLKNTPKISRSGPDEMAVRCLRVKTGDSNAEVVQVQGLGAPAVRKLSFWQLMLQRAPNASIRKIIRYRGYLFIAFVTALIIFIPKCTAYRVDRQMQSLFTVYTIEADTKSNCLNVTVKVNKTLQPVQLAQGEIIVKVTDVSFGGLGGNERTTSTLFTYRVTAGKSLLTINTPLPARNIDFNNPNDRSKKLVPDWQLNPMPTKTEVTCKARIVIFKDGKRWAAEGSESSL